jgi:hypothetical protein
MSLTKLSLDGKIVNLFFTVYVICSSSKAVTGREGTQGGGKVRGGGMVGGGGGGG